MQQQRRPQQQQPAAPRPLTDSSSYNRAPQAPAKLQRQQQQLLLRLQD
jgi:hypothetical protein